MRDIVVALLVIFIVALVVFTRWMKTIQLPRLIAERTLLGIPSGQSYWSWPKDKKLERLVSERELNRSQIKILEMLGFMVHG